MFKRERVRFRPGWHRNDAERALPDDIIVALVKSLFRTKSALILSVVVTSCISVKVSFDTGSPVIIGLAALLFAVGIARIGINEAFQRIDTTDLSRAKALQWERRFARVALFNSSLSGTLIAFILVTVNANVDILLVEALACGVSSAIIARNSARPRLAMQQVAWQIMPMCLCCLWRMDSGYAILAFIDAVFVLTAISIIRSHYDNMLQLLTATREKTNLASSLALQNAMFDAMLENMSHGLCAFDAQQRVIIANKRYQDLLRLPDKLIRSGTCLRDIVAFSLAAEGQGDRIEEVLSTFGADLVPSMAKTSVWALNDGRRLALSQRPMSSGGIVVLFEDVTERDRAAARIAHMASHDGLTDLPNRATLNDRLARDLESLRLGAGLALFCLDLDRFKAVNDTLGHAAGDALLCAVADRIRATITPTMMAARIGGNEFVILANGIDEAGAIDFAWRLIAALSAPYRIVNRPVAIGASVGIARADDRAVSPQELFRQADTALYQAKNGGRGQACLFAAPLVAAA